MVIQALLSVSFRSFSPAEVLSPCRTFVGTSTVPFLPTPQS
jgi:hypothetical protein